MADDFKVQFGVEFDVSDIDAQINKVNQSIKSKKVKMQAEFDDSLLNKSYTSALNKLSSLNNATVRLNRLDTSQLDANLNKKINEIKTKINTLSSEAKFQIDFDGTIDNKLSSNISKAVAEYKNLYSEANRAKSETIDLANQSKSLKNIESYMANNSKAVGQYGEKLNSLKERMGKATSNVELANLNKEFVTLRKEIDATGNAGKTFGDILSNNVQKFGEWIVAGTIFMGVQNGIQNTIQDIRELDSAMVELKKVTDESDESYTSFYYNANELAKELGSSTKELISSTATWAQMGYGLKDATELAKASAIMDTISPEMNLDQSTEGMISAIKAYGIEAEDALDGVASKVNLVGNEFSLTNSDVIEMLKRSGAALADANNSINQSIALAVPAIEVTRDAASTGQALKTIQARIRGINEETGVLDGTLQTIKGELYDITGVEIYDSDTGVLRSTYDIISDIADIYDTLTDKQKYKVLDLLGGKRQINQVSAILNNFDTSRQALERLSESAGNAETEFAKAQESIEYRMNRLVETGVGISQNIINTDAFKVVIDTLTALGEAIDFITEKSGGLGTVFGIIGGIAGAKGLGVTDIFSFDKGFGSAIIPEELKNSLDDISNEINTTGVNLDNLKQRFGSNAQAIYDYANGLNGATANAKGLSSAIGRATIAQKAHTIAVTAGQIALNAFIGLGVGLAINGIISALDALIVTQDELDDKVIESKNNYESSKQALADVNTELENNQKQIDELLGKGKLTYVEQAELDKLKEATKELESQKKLKENEVSKDQRELAIDTANSSKKYTNIGTNTFQEELDFYKKNNNDYTGSSWDSDSEAILPNIQRYEQLKQQLSEITAGTNEWAEKSSEVNEQETKLQDLLTSITEDLSNYELEVQKIKKTEESTWDSNDKKIIKSYEYAQEYYDLLRNTLDPKQYKADQLEKVFNSKDIEKTKKELVEMTRKGDLKNLNVDEMPKLKEAMDEAGISAEELKYELEAIADDPLTSIDNNAASLTELSSTIQTVTEDLENLNLAIEESVSSSGLTEESIDNIISMFAGLDGYDASELFENTANGVHLNAEELRKLTAEYEKTQGKKYAEDLKDLREEYQELCVEIANTTSATERNQLINERNTLKNQIDQAEQLQAQFKGLTSAYTQWEEAMSSPNEGDTYMSVVNNLKDIQELYKQGLVGTDDFRASVQLMSNQDLSTASVEKLMSEYEKGLPKMKRYFQESSNGVLNFLKDLEKANSEFAHMNKDGSWDINFNDEAIAKAMNLNVETVQQIGRRLMDYGFDINFDDSIDELYELRDAADKALDGFKDKKFKIDLDADGVDEINKQLDKIDEKREEINNSDLEPKVKTDQLEDLDDLESYLQAKLGEMADKQYVIDIEANRNQLDESLEKLRELELIDAKVEIDFDSESAQYIGQEIEAIEGVLEDLYGTDGEIDLSVKGAQEATDILIALINKQTEINNKSVVMDVDTSKLEAETQTVLTKLQEIQQAYNTLNSLESLQATGKVSIDDSEIEAAQANVNTLVNDLMKKHPELIADLKLNKETFQADLQGLTANDLVVRANVDSTAIKNYTPDQKTMTVKGNTSDVDNKLKKIDENVKKNRTIQFYQNGLTTIQNYLNNIKSKTVTVTVRQSGSVNLNGSSRLNGTAYAGGNIGAKKTEVALTGEEKPELRVNAKTGRWELLGKDGAEFAKINKGDIIFNGDQTEKLFKNGKILGRGKSFLKGTVGGLASIFGKGSGKSYFSGSGTLYSNGKVKTTTSSKKSSTKKNTKKSSSSADEFLETWDYIEIAIDRIEEQISRLDTKASSVYRSWSSRNSNLTSQMSKIRQEIDLQNKAYNKYMSEANKINLSSSYKDKLRNGQISLQDITDKDLNKKMKEYLDLVNKAQDAKTAVIELQEDLSDAYAQRFENVITYWEARVEQVESLMDDIETMVDMNEAKGMFSSKDYYETLIKMENDNIANLQNERNELINAMNEALDSGAIVRYSENWCFKCPFV